MYIGPDQLAPAASVFAAVAGAVMLFWGRLTALIRRIGRKKDPR